MFISLDQPRIFLCCLFIGIVCGLVYEPFSFIKLIFKTNAVNHVLDCLWLIASLFVFTYLGVIFSLPDFRWYMFLSVLLGFYFYEESFHKVFAFLENKLYNIISKSFSKLFKKLKVKNERRKEKKNILGGSVRVNNAGNVTRGNRNLSNGGNIHAKKQNRRVGRGNRLLKNSNRAN